MNNSYYGIALDIKSVQSQVTFPVKQGDTSRGIKIILTDGGKAYLIERNCSATFKGKKSDGKKINNICTIENNRIVYHITEQTVASPGIVDCEVSLFDPNGNLITTPRFTLIVDSRVGGDDYESTDEYNALEHYLSEVEKAELERQANEEERQTNEEARKNALATKIDENSTYEQYASAKAAYEYARNLDLPEIYGQQVIALTGHAKIWELATGVYRIGSFVEYKTDTMVKCDEGTTIANGLLCVAKGLGGYSWFLVSAGMSSYRCFVGETSLDGTSGSYSEVYNYSEAKANKLSEYKEDATDEQYYSAKAVNEVFIGVGELFEIASKENDEKLTEMYNGILEIIQAAQVENNEKFATKDYVNEQLGVIDNGRY